MALVIRRHIYILLTLAASQVACLGCGLWMQDQLLLKAAHFSINPEGAEGPAELTVDAIVNSMPATRILSLLWIGGLQIVVAYLVLMRVLNETSRKQEKSKIRLLHREKDLLRTRNSLIFGLAKLAEHRDQETGQHLERIALYSARLAIAVRKDPRFRERISANFVKSIGISSVLHDIGKVGIEDAVLRKPGQFEADERARMELHTTVGGECIRQIELRLGNANFLQMAREIALYHHEKWDGSGYPNGLAGEQIPLAARLVAIADVYDALSAKRVYKRAFPHEKCVQIIRDDAGKHFDPGMVEVFLSIEEEFREIGARFTDTCSQDTPWESAKVQESAVNRAADKKLINSVLHLDEVEVEVEAELQAV